MQINKIPIFAFILTVGICFLISVSSVQAVCLNLTDPSTWDSPAQNGNVYVMNSSQTLCSGGNNTFMMNNSGDYGAILSNCNKCVLDCNGTTIRGGGGGVGAIIQAKDYSFNITGCGFNNTVDGIRVYSWNNSIKNNTINDSISSYAIHIMLAPANNSTITGNNLAGGLFGLRIRSSWHNITSNNFTSNAGLGGGIEIIANNGYFNRIFNNNFRMGNTSVSIISDSGQQSSIYNNNLSNSSSYCYHMVTDSVHNFSGNNITNCAYGVYVGPAVSGVNIIYNNWFSDHIIGNAYTHSSASSNVNFFVTPYLGINIIGGSWIGGNFWSDYTGHDTDGDGIGNTELPYNISVGKTDDYPLTEVASAPTIFILDANESNITTHRIEFNVTDPDNDTIAWCSLYRNGTNVSHLTTLANNTIYNFTFDHYDINDTPSNWFHADCNDGFSTNTSSNYSINTSIPPYGVSGLSGAPTATAITWIWTYPNNTDLTTARIYLDGVKQGSDVSVNPSTTDLTVSSGLNVNTAYTLTVETADVNGYANNTSAVATTLSGGGGGGTGGGGAPTIIEKTVIVNETRGICNFNNICEADRGESVLTCREDCAVEFGEATTNPFVQTILIIVFLTFLAIFATGGSKGKLGKQIKNIIIPPKKKRRRRTF